MELHVNDQLTVNHAHSCAITGESGIKQGPGYNVHSFLTVQYDYCRPSQICQASMSKLAMDSEGT